MSLYTKYTIDCFFTCRLNSFSTVGFGLHWSSEIIICMIQWQYVIRVVPCALVHYANPFFLPFKSPAKKKVCADNAHRQLDKIGVGCLYIKCQSYIYFSIPWTMFTVLREFKDHTLPLNCIQWSKRFWQLPFACCSI